MSDPARSSEQVSGVSNVAADLVTLLHNKLDAIAALERYKQDAQGDQEISSYFDELEQAEVQAIGRLKSLVTQRLGQ